MLPEILTGINQRQYRKPHAMAPLAGLPIAFIWEAVTPEMQCSIALPPSPLLSHCLLLLLSHFSRVRLCATPWTAAHQAPPSLGFSKQEHWSGLPFPSPVHESESEVAQSCPTLRDPMDCSLPGSSVHGIFQARVLEWVPLEKSIVQPSHRELCA